MGFPLVPPEIQVLNNENYGSEWRPLLVVDIKIAGVSEPSVVSWVGQLFKTRILQMCERFSMISAAIV